MKYLVYFKPDKSLAELIINQDCVIIPSSGLHCTIAVFYMNPENEEKLISELSRIKFNSFKVKTLGFDDFDNDSFVLRLSLPEALFELHKRVFSAVAHYADDDFWNVVSKYFLDNYNPHFTISKSSSHFNRSLGVLINREFFVDSFYLSKKENGFWKQIKVFYSSL